MFFDDRVGGHVNGVYGNIFYSPTGATNLYNFHSYNTYTFGNNLFYGAHPSDEPSDAHKLTSNPLLVAPGLGGGMGGTNNLSTLSGYKLQAGSPCIDSGFMPTTNLTGNVNAAGQDFFGNPVPAGPGPDLYVKASPITYVFKEAPAILIVHGTADATVPLSQSQALDAALTRAGAEHQLVIVPGAPHTFHLQPKQRDLRPLVFDFFASHLKPGLGSPVNGALTKRPGQP